MAASPSAIDLPQITGPPFISIILNWGLFGVLSIQVYIYFQSFPRDKLQLKFIVGVVYVVEILQTFLLTGTIWKFVVTRFGNIEAADEIDTAWFSVCFIGGLVACVVQSFYSYRIAVVSQKRILPIAIILMSLVSFSGALATGILSKRASKFSILLTQHEKLAAITTGLWIGTSSLCDIVIATCMCYYLQQCQHGTFSRTQALLTKLVRMTIETGVLTASISTLTLILYYLPTFKHVLYFEGPMSVGAKLYSTTLLVVLNSRIQLRNTSSDLSRTWRAELEGDVSQSSIRLKVVTSGDSSGILSHSNIMVTKEVVRSEA